MNNIKSASLYLLQEVSLGLMTSSINTGSEQDAENEEVVVSAASAISSDSNNGDIDPYISRNTSAAEPVVSMNLLPHPFNNLSVSALIEDSPSTKEEDEGVVAILSVPSANNQDIDPYLSHKSSLVEPSVLPISSPFPQLMPLNMHRASHHLQPHFSEKDKALKENFIVIKRVFRWNVCQTKLDGASGFHAFYGKKNRFGVCESPGVRFLFSDKLDEELNKSPPIGYVKEAFLLVLKNSAAAAFSEGASVVPAIFSYCKHLFTLFREKHKKLEMSKNRPSRTEVKLLKLIFLAFTSKLNSSVKVDLERPEDSVLMRSFFIKPKAFLLGGVEIDVGKKEKLRDLLKDKASFACLKKAFGYLPHWRQIEVEKGSRIAQITKEQNKKITEFIWLPAVLESYKLSVLEGGYRFSTQELYLLGALYGKKVCIILGDEPNGSEPKLMEGGDPQGEIVTIYKEKEDYFHCESACQQGDI